MSQRTVMSFLCHNYRYLPMDASTVEQQFLTLASLNLNFVWLIALSLRCPTWLNWSYLSIKLDVADMSKCIIGRDDDIVTMEAYLGGPLCACLPYLPMVIAFWENKMRFRRCQVTGAIYGRVAQDWRSTVISFVSGRHSFRHLWTHLRALVQMRFERDMKQDPCQHSGCISIADGGTYHPPLKSCRANQL